MYPLTVVWLIIVHVICIDKQQPPDIGPHFLSKRVELVVLRVRVWDDIEL